MDPDTATSQQTQTNNKVLPPFNVVLLDDQFHSYDYVIRMMRRLFNHSDSRALAIATAVDKHGRVVCLTTHKELAELKRDQILAFGRDEAIAACVGSMTAIIEPAQDPEEGGDSGDPA